MRRRSSILKLSAVTVSLLSLAELSCSSGGGGPGPKCVALDSYTPTATTAPSFATAVYPILANTMAAKGCAQTLICHGDPAVAIDTATGAKTLVFTAAAATVKTALLGAPVNAPGMKMVVASDVGASFLAYKISGADGLACVNSSCTSGASIGASKPCGDPMPTSGVLTDAERTTILDWIAMGAVD